MELTQEYLRSILKYDLLTGNFTWIVNRNSKARKNTIAGFINNNKGKKYRHIMINYKMYKAHRLAFLYVLSEFPSYQVDHINGDGTDNRWINLRPVTSKENRRNQKLHSTNTSGYVGVTWNKHKGKWQAGIGINNKLIYLGSFLDIRGAIKARKEANIKYGFHENHGQVRTL